MEYNERKNNREPISQKTNDIAKSIVDSAICVHSTLGPGLLESVYEICLIYELRSRGHTVESQVAIPINYKELRIESGLRLDLLVDDAIIVEVKAVESLLPIHEAQLLSYQKLTGKRLGFLINFKSHLLKDGIKRYAL